MDRVQGARLRMYVAVVVTLQSVIDSLGVAALSAKLQLLIAKIARIYQLAPIQNQTSRGKTMRRDELSQGMVDLALHVANAVVAHADAHQLTELTQTVDVSTGTFDRLRIPHRPILAQRIHDVAQPLIADLEEYAVTAETLTDLQAQIDLVKTWLDQPRAIIRSRSVATAQLAETFREIDALIEDQIDRLVFSLRKTNPDFYLEYQKARQLLDTPGAHSTRDDATPEAAPAANSASSPIAKAA